MKWDQGLVCPKALACTKCPQAYIVGIETSGV